MFTSDFYCIEYKGDKGYKWYSKRLFRSVRHAKSCAKVECHEIGAVAFEIIPIDIILYRACTFK